MTRTRRKFWDDVSVRGGQYSALMIVLTGLYALFQGPFQEMKYGLKFAQMRVMDGLSTANEKEIYHKVSKKVGCLFMIKFWFMYWFSFLYFSCLSCCCAKEKASEFIEYFNFIMHMKDMVKFQLSMRKIALLYHYVEPRLPPPSNDNGDQEDSAQA